MRIAKWACVCVLAISGLAIADGEKALEGQWKVVSVTKNGTVDATWTDAVREHTGDKYTMAKGGGKSVTGTFKIDAAKKTIDTMPGEGTYKGKTLLGIYELEGNTLKICFAEPGKDRPTKIATSPDSGTTVAIYTKVK
jgi:uncharacterized protein (TIGR03067 family)